MKQKLLKLDEKSNERKKILNDFVCALKIKKTSVHPFLLLIYYTYVYIYINIYINGIYRYTRLKILGTCARSFQLLKDREFSLVFDYFKNSKNLK